MPATSVMSFESSRPTLSTSTAGRPYTSSSIRTSSTFMRESDCGMRSVNFAPFPGSDSTATEPPRPVTRLRTTSSPTPRPLVSPAWSRVENPGVKMRSSAARAERLAACCSPMIPFLSAAARIFCGLMPRPSSSTVIASRSPSVRAARTILPMRGFAAAARSSGSSMPWSTQLRTRWTSGSFSERRIALSTPVSPPRTTHSTSLPCSRAMSRAARGNPPSTPESGMRRALPIRSARSPYCACAEDAASVCARAKRKVSERRRWTSPSTCSRSFVARRSRSRSASATTRSESRAQRPKSALRSRDRRIERAPSTSTSPASVAISSSRSTSTRMDETGFAPSSAFAGSTRMASCSPVTVAFSAPGAAGCTGGAPAMRSRSAPASFAAASPPSDGDSSIGTIASHAFSRASRRSPGLSAGSAFRRSSAAWTTEEIPTKPIIRASPFSVCSSRASSSDTSGVAAPRSISSSAAEIFSTRSAVVSRKRGRSFWRISSETPMTGSVPALATASVDLEALHELREPLGELRQLGGGAGGLLRARLRLAGDLLDLRHGLHDLLGRGPLLLGGEVDDPRRVARLLDAGEDARHVLHRVRAELLALGGLALVAVGRLLRGVRRLADLGDEVLDLLRRLHDVLGEAPHLGRDDREPAPRLARLGALEGGVQGEQVGAVGDLVDHLDDRADPLDALRQLRDRVVHLDGVVAHLLHREHEGLDRPLALAAAREGLLRDRRDHLRVLGDLVRRALQLLHRGGRLVDRRRLRARRGLVLRRGGEHLGGRRRELEGRLADLGHELLQRLHHLADAGDERRQGGVGDAEPQRARQVALDDEPDHRLDRLVHPGGDDLDALARLADLGLDVVGCGVHRPRDVLERAPLEQGEVEPSTVLADGERAQHGDDLVGRGRPRAVLPLRRDLPRRLLRIHSGVAHLHGLSGVVSRGSAPERSRTRE